MSARTGGQRRREMRSVVSPVVEDLHLVGLSLCDVEAGAQQGDDDVAVQPPHKLSQAPRVGKVQRARYACRRKRHASSSEEGAAK